MAATLVGAGWATLWAAEHLLAPVGPEPAPLTAAPPAAQRQPIFRRSDIRPSLRNPSADAREFFFTRAVYNSGYRWSSWATDYPKADRQFLIILERLIDLDAYESERTRSGSTIPTSASSPSCTPSRSGTCT